MKTSYRNQKGLVNLKRSAYFLSLAGLIMLHTSCGSDGETSSSDSNSTSWSKSSKKTKKRPTETGVVTVVEETKDNEYTTVSETIVPKKEESLVIINKLDGKTDTLKYDAIKALVNDPNQPIERDEYRGSSFGLGNVLFWGSMGYLAGRALTKRGNSGVYKNPQAYQQSQTTANSIKSNQTAARNFSSSKTRPATSKSTSKPSKSAPSGGKSGFFNSGSKSTGG